MRPRTQPGGEDVDRARAMHMLNAARQAIAFITGKTRADLDTDHMLRRALVNAVQEIGEAAARMSDAGRERVAGVPWGQVVETRNVIVHVYWGIDLDIVWQTAQEDLQPLAAALEAALAMWPPEQG